MRICARERAAPLFPSADQCTESTRQAHFHAAFGQKSFQRLDILRRIVKNRGGERGVGATFGERGQKIARSFCATRSNYGHVDGLRHGGSQRRVKSLLSAVPVD